MNEDIQKYKELLTAQLLEITKELEAVGIHDPSNPQNWVAIPDGVDANESDSDMTADIAEEWGERNALVETLETRYNNLTRALKKIKDGTFGVCEICGGPIESDRLHANPSSRTDKLHMNDESSLTL